MMVCSQIARRGTLIPLPQVSQQPWHGGPPTSCQLWLSFKVIPQLRGVGKSHRTSWKLPLFQVGGG